MRPLRSSAFLSAVLFAGALALFSGARLLPGADRPEAGVAAAPGPDRPSVRETEGNSASARTTERDGERNSAAARASFAVRYHGLVVPWRTFLLRALPGEAVPLEIRAPAEAPGADAGAPDGVPPGRYGLEAEEGAVARTGPAAWVWTAPEAPGLHRLTVTRSPGGGEAAAAVESITLTAAVLVPVSRIRGGEVGRYRVGEYPEEVFRGLDRYRKPRGFVRVDPEHAELPVSPHFRLDQFSVHRPHRWPKYTVLHERLLVKAELLVERAAERGVPAEGWRVLSGYRSPWYNGSIGRPRFSRHIFGDAADLYVDVDGDGRMDDLTGDGRVDVRDADLLHGLVEDLDADADLRPLLGGLGKYRTTRNHGPFIHLDTRGYRARW